jgi:D-apionolactonase
LEVLRANQVSLARILALREGEAATSVATLAWVRKHFESLGAPIGAGSDCNFCELNRDHALGKIDTRTADFLFWSINPQVHAFDHLSIMETLEAQSATVASARRFAAGKPLVISPVTLRQRFNPVATTSQLAAPGELPPQVDPRQLSHFAAAWTLGSIVALARADVDSITYYETAGWRGVMERAAGSPLADKFPAQPGLPFPIFHAFSHLAGFDQGAPAIDQHSQRVSAFGLYNEGTLQRVVVANLSMKGQTVALKWPCGARSEEELAPYEVARAIPPLSPHP